MKKGNLIMFLILQILLVITNFVDLNNTYLILELKDILKICIILFSLLYILFIANQKTKNKLMFVICFGLLGMMLALEKSDCSKIVNIFYYISTYTYLLCFYKNNGLKRYNIINLSTLLLFGLCLYSLISKNNSIEIELLINLLLPLSLTYFHTNYKVLLPIVLLSLLTSFFSGMYLILLNTTIVSIILIWKSKTNKETIISGILLLLSVILIYKCDIFNVNSLIDVFYKIDIQISVSSITAMIPLVILSCSLFSNYLENKNKPLGLTLNIYVIIIYVSLGTLSLNNINEGLSLVMLVYTFVITINYIEYLKKEIKNEVTIMALHLGYGGIEQYISSLTKMIDKKVNIISTYKLYNKEPFKYNASIKYLMNYGPNTKEVKEAIMSKKHIIKEVIKSLMILYKKKYQNIEAIENINTKYIITTRDFHNEYVGFYARKDIIKIGTEHNDRSDESKYTRRVIHSVENLDYFVLVSKKLENFYKGKVKCKTIYIPNVLDNNPKKYSKAKDHSIITVGRLVKVKGYDDLIKVVELLKEDYKDISVTIIGDGEEKEHLTKLIEKKKLEKNIRLTGFLNKDEIETEMLKNNLFVMTSFSESFGLVAIEACSYKLPVVAFDSAEGLKEILSDGNGVLIEKRDLNKMKEEISKLFEDRKYRNKIAKAGYEHSKNYLSENVKEMWTKLIN